jgi:hypothetical protein
VMLFERKKFGSCLQCNDGLPCRVVLNFFMRALR